MRECELCLHGICGEICRECPVYYGLDPKKDPQWKSELQAIKSENEYERKVLR